MEIAIGCRMRSKGQGRHALHPLAESIAIIRRTELCKFEMRTRAEEWAIASRRALAPRKYSRVTDNSDAMQMQ